ncbi:hypothetical protein BVRB_6g142040 [Beta vulgaris subsp. vulgaris]|nr:hypothetical protein BVRB_6g142040 [Beta vulgaris subsp. vulgaris]
MEELSHRKRTRTDLSEFEFDSTNAKKMRDDLLSLLDDSDPAPDRDPVSHDLDSVIKSFEEEISRSSPATVIDLTSDSGEFLPELGKVTGDGAGLLPETESGVGDGSELVRVSYESSGIGEFWNFQDELLPCYDSFGFAFGFEQNHESNEYVTLDGIFDYSDVNLGSEFSWRPDSTPASIK